MLFHLALLSMLVLPSAALRVSMPTTRRQALATGASLAPAFVLLPQVAHADAIEDIAARNALAAKEAQQAKAEAAERKALLDSAGGGLNAVLSVGILGLIGGIGYFALGIKSKSDETQTFNMDRNRLMTDSERRQAANLSAAEKRKLGIKD